MNENMGEPQSDLTGGCLGMTSEGFEDVVLDFLRVYIKLYILAVAVASLMRYIYIESFYLFHTGFSQSQLPIS
jgi:hypothetical protein